MQEVPIKKDPQATQAENKQLRENINLLGRLLGEAIRTYRGQAVYEKVEQLRALTKSWRAENGVQVDEITKFCDDLENKTALPILKAFTTYFHLVNLAEEAHRVRVLRAREEAKDDPLADSIGETIFELQAQGITAEQLQSMVEGMLVDLVFTAHPTESKRRLTLEKLGRTSRALSQLDYEHLLAREREALLNELRVCVSLIWLTDEVRRRKPSVLDEVQNGLWYFDENLFDLLPDFYEAFERALREAYPDYEFKLPTVLYFGSWMGGDRDGNPFVTSEVTAETLNLHRDLARRYFSQQVALLTNELSLAIPRDRLTPEIRQFLDQNREQYPDFAKTLTHQQEPYRLMLDFIGHRLSQPPTLTYEGITYESEHVYSSGQQLLADLHLVAEGLQKTAPLLVERRVQPLIRQVETFGLHTARLDIRQHSAEHEAVISELLAKGHITSNYTQLSEPEKISLLNEMLQEMRFPTVPPVDLSERATELLDLFRLLRRTMMRNPESIGCYLISMSHEPSDVLEVLWLAGMFNLYRPQIERSSLDIAPLFETVSDLENAKTTLTDLVQVPSYRQHLALRGDQQIVQLGYSDGTKDGGYLMANWMLYRAQQSMAEFARENEVKLIFFHGRGGTVGRGGGPTDRVIRGLPPEAMRGSIRLTEQGEMVFDRFAHPAIALRYLEQVAGAALKVSAGQADLYKPEWSDWMTEMSEAAFKAYRSLVYETPNFMPYFQQATPIDIVTELTIGSRPAKRDPGGKKTQFMEGLRAIPWVFAWMQSRHALPGWYGLGSALNQQLEQDGLAKLQEMYQEWPFFQAVISNAQMALAKADMKIAGCYANLVTDDMVREEIFGRILAEYQRTEQAILAITEQERLLDNEAVLQRAIQLRNPYVDPLNFIQVMLLKRLRALPDNSPNRRRLIDGLRLSIVGIAAGLKNMG